MQKLILLAAAAAITSCAWAQQSAAPAAPQSATQTSAPKAKKPKVERAAATHPYSTEVKPLEQVVAEVGKLLGKSLTVDPKLAGRLVVIGFRYGTDEELMALLEDASFGKWEVSGDKQVLMPSGRKYQDYKARVLKDRLTALRKMVDSMKKTGEVDSDGLQDAPGGPPAEVISEEEVQSATPEDLALNAARVQMIQSLRKLVADAIEMLNLNEVVALQPGQVVEYSTSPLGMQRAMPGKTLTAFNAWRMGQRGLPNDIQGTVLQLTLGQSSFDAFNFGTNARVRLYNSQGVSVHEDEFPLSDMAGMFGMGMEEGDESLGSYDIKLSEEGKLLASLSGGDPKQDKELLAKVRRIVTDPVKYEPLDLGADDWLLARWKAEKMNGCAYLPDAAMLGAVIAGQGGNNRGGIQLFKMIGRCEFLTSDDLEVVYPSLELGQECQTPRKELANHFAMILNPSDSEQIIHNEISRSAPIFTPSYPYLFATLLTEAEEFEIPMTRQLHHLFTSGQDQMFKNGSVMVSSLTGLQKQILGFILSGQDGEGSFAPVPGKPQEGIWNNPTAMLTQAQIGNAVISRTITSDSTYFMSAGQDRFFPTELEAICYGFAHPESYDAEIQFKIVPSSVYAYTLNFGGGFQLTFNVKTYSNRSNAKVYTYATLPPDLKDKIDKMMGEIIKSEKAEPLPGGTGGGDGGS